MADETDDDKTLVPRARLAEEAAKRRAALTRVAELEAALAEAEGKAATVDTLAAQVAKLTAEATTTAADWETERAVWQVGLTDSEGIDIARHLHSRLPADNRPKMAEWLGGLKADPTKAPKALAPYLAPAPAADPPAPEAGKATTTRATGAAPAATGGAAAAAAKYTPEQIRGVRERATQTGDWTEWNAAKAAMLGSVGR